MSNKKIESLVKVIKERELDHYYADNWEQATQITENIEELKLELDNLKKGIEKNEV